MPTSKIAFHLSHFSIRGSEVAIFEYAHYNEEILHNKSFIAVHKGFRDIKDYRGFSIHDENIWKKFSSRFHIIEYTSKEDLSGILKENNISIFYNLKSGENDGFLIDGVKNVCHCVFTYTSSHNHGDIYIPISPSIVDKNVKDIVSYVPHIVCPLPKVDNNIREFLKIPSDAIVFGRYGGDETFNIDFVKEAIIEIAYSNPNIFFIFVNTQLFTHPRHNIIFLEKISNPRDKTIFINTCDAMIHARKEGESFGLAIAEFSMANKPVITWKHDRTHAQVERDFNIKIDVEHTHHIDTLGDSGIYYSDKRDFIEIIKNFTKRTADDKYSEIYSPSKVMSLFQKYIIDSPYSRFIESTIFDEKIYTHFSNDSLAETSFLNGWDHHLYDVLKNLLKPDDTFIDIGSNIGYHTLRASSLVPNGKIMSIEPCKPIFELLKHNVAINNIKNVMCIKTCLFSKSTSLFMDELSRYTVNFGDIKMYVNRKENSLEIQSTDLDSLLENQNVKVGVIKIDVCGNEIEVVKGGLQSIMKYRPYIIIPLQSKMFKSNSCSSIKHLMGIIGYSMIEIDSDYPCDHLCYPFEKHQSIEEIFKERIADNTTNTINDNRLLGITKKIIPEQISLNREIRVKLLCNWTTGKDLCKVWEKMSKGNGVWNNIHLVYDDKNIDYYVVINKPRDGDKYIPSKTIVFRMETSLSGTWDDWYVDKSKFLYILDLYNHRSNTEWHLQMNVSELQDSIISKTKVISTVISSLYEMEGHKKRIDFVKYCQSRGLEIDVYGRDNLHNLKNHKGDLPYHNKNNGILPYKYTFIAENAKVENYFTEKIVDAILGECLCFYWGCPNIDSFIDPKAYVLLDLDDMEKSYDKMISYINNNEWMNRLSYIMKEKEKIINNYSFFPRLEGYILTSQLRCKVINLDRRKDRWDKFLISTCKESFNKYDRVSAIDGSKLVISTDIKNLFRNFTNRKPKAGEIGCALTHLNLWRDIKTDTLILEDDITLCRGFNDRLSLIYGHVKNNIPDFDILYIGYILNRDIHKEYPTDPDNKFIIPLKDIMDSSSTEKNIFGYHGGGTYGYIISPKGASKLVSHISTNGFVTAVDYQMLAVDHSSLIKSYCCITPLVYSETLYDNNIVDTDIQNSKIVF